MDGTQSLPVVISFSEPVRPISPTTWSLCSGEFPNANPIPTLPTYVLWFAITILESFKVAVPADPLLVPLFKQKCKSDVLLPVLP